MIKYVKSVLLIFLIILKFNYVLSVSSNNNTSDYEYKQLFRSYVIKFNKPYIHNEKQYRRRYEIFKNSLENIQIMNSQRKHKDGALYGLTKFSDMTQLEFLSNKLYESLAPQLNKTSKNNIVKAITNDEEDSVEDDDEILDSLLYQNKQIFLKKLKLPTKVDWRDVGVVSPIQDQGACGSCYVRSVLSTVESMVAIKQNRTDIEELSVQQMLDCSEYSTWGCDGGDICRLLKWLVHENIPILSVNDYPLASSGWHSDCQFDYFKHKISINPVRVHNYTCRTLIGEEFKILKHLAYYGPLAVSVNALSWQNYLGGIILYHCEDDWAAINHAVQIVGYDMTGAIPYYIIKNTWGINYGDNGYVKIAIGKNLCGIANKVAHLNAFTVP